MGWLNGSNLAAIGRATPDELARQHVVLFGLLAALRATGVLELRLKNSEGIGCSAERCVFERGAGRARTRWGGS